MPSEPRGACITPWIRVFTRRSRPPRARLLCCPYAGGSAGIFRTWATYLPLDVELWALQYPGREERLLESAFTRVTDLVATAAQSIGGLLEQVPYVIFGHSLGALVAFELIRELRRGGQPLPKSLFVSGARNPRFNAFKGNPRHLWPDPEFIGELRRIGGTPPDLLENEELMDLMLPTLRADFALVDTYEYREGAPLELPIHAFGGDEDREVRPESLMAWGAESRAAFSLSMFSGDHFFLNGHAPRLCEAITRIL